MATSPTIAQRDEVYARLARLRHDLESLIKRVSDGNITLAQVLALSEHDTTAQFVYLVKIAEAVPGVGKVRARRALESLGYGERTRVGDVPPARHAQLVDALT